jgi:SEC-C motif
VAVAVGLPFACPRCGLQWDDGDYGMALIAGGEGASIVDSSITTNCPRCGGNAALVGDSFEVRGGRWQVIRQLADDLRSASASRADYACLRDLVRQAQADGREREKLAADIEAQTPFANLAQTIRAHPPGWTAYLLAAILAVVLWYFAPPGGTAPAPANPGTKLEQLSPQQLDELAQQIAQQLSQDGAAVPKATAGPQSVKGSERNLPCQCGSGMKAKKCCANPARQAGQK